MGQGSTELAGAGADTPVKIAGTDRTWLWLPLLQGLSARFPTFAVWKNPDSALHGSGDVDALADPGCWPEIEDEFRAWAARHGLDHVIVCRHVPQGPHFVAFGPDSRHLLQLDVKTHATLRGSTLLSWRDLARLSIDDTRGFRRARPGAEGVVKLLSNGLLPDGRPAPEALRRKGVRALLAADPDGVASMARTFGPAAPALRRAAAAAARGGWDRPAMLAVEAWCLLRAVVEPRTLLSRLRFKYYTRVRCPVIRTIRSGDRVIPPDRATWLAEVRRTHPGAVAVGTASAQEAAP